MIFYVFFFIERNIWKWKREIIGEKNQTFWYCLLKQWIWWTSYNIHNNMLYSKRPWTYFRIFFYEEDLTFNFKERIEVKNRMGDNQCWACGWACLYNLYGDVTLISRKLFVRVNNRRFFIIFSKGECPFTVLTSLCKKKELFMDLHLSILTCLV